MEFGGGGAVEFEGFCGARDTLAESVGAACLARGLGNDRVVETSGAGAGVWLAETTTFDGGDFKIFRSGVEA